MMFHKNSFQNLLSKDYLGISKKIISCSLILIIVGLLIIFFKLSFYRYSSYYVIKEMDNTYQVMVPYQDTNLWLDNKCLYYQKNKYHYDVKQIADEVSYQNNIVYLPILIEIDNFSSKLPVLEVSLTNDKVTIMDYLKTKLEGE